MGWIQLQMRTTPDQVQALEAHLQNQGAQAITYLDAADQALFEPERGETPFWNDILLSALFSDELSPPQLLELIQTGYEGQLPALDFSLLEDQAWERSWIENFKPMSFGDRLSIYPSWTEAPESGGVIMKLDPGLAFGTGTHPTTALCLNWLDQQNLDQLTLVDYGCGSGILGIAALLLGAVKVYGVDNDPQALQATHDNCDKNQLDKTKFPVLLPTDFVAEINRKTIAPCDLLLANILAGPLISLARYLGALVKPGGQILLSGILEEQSDAVLEAYQNDFTLSPPVIQDGWVRIDGRRLN